MTETAAPADGEVFTMFTAAHRSLLLRAHKALEKTIKFTNGGLAALGASPADVKHVEVQAAKLKKMLDDAHDRDRWTYDAHLRNIGAQALSILVERLTTLRKSAIEMGVEDPEDIDGAVEMAKNIGRQLRAELFPVEPKQEALDLSGKGGDS